MPDLVNRMYRFIYRRIRFINRTKSNVLYKYMHDFIMLNFDTNGTPYMQSHAKASVFDTRAMNEAINRYSCYHKLIATNVIAQTNLLTYNPLVASLVSQLQKIA